MFYGCVVGEGLAPPALPQNKEQENIDFILKRRYNIPIDLFRRNGDDPYEKKSFERHRGENALVL